MDEKLNNNVNYWLVSFVVIATYGGLVIGDEDYSQIQTNNGTKNCKYVYVFSSSILYNTVLVFYACIQFIYNLSLVLRRISPIAESIYSITYYMQIQDAWLFTIVCSLHKE